MFHFFSEAENQKWHKVQSQSLEAVESSQKETDQQIDLHNIYS